jgi:hypothetical protein
LKKYLSIKQKELRTWFNKGAYSRACPWINAHTSRADCNDACLFATPA